MPESGTLAVTGVRAEVTFYKDLLDKLGVKAEILQMGDYKGTGETFTRSGMSPEFREDIDLLVDDYLQPNDRHDRRRPQARSRPCERSCR